ncbi:hypothetical protein GCM10017083_16490 [Thalassobaculum fulvum]|uniref:Peptidase M48 domain-containing protein n=1 Tax=Thalassobaculum fulvum TaxID=1633335 RepID=A0A918XQM2_9PROT|nr:M48 family metalloprotease [Thalassobaculum fulvum]GHD46863.1 hypothetical protein GCM10017083_16490 [Thalassobaculum fulvum]
MIGRGLRVAVLAAALLLACGGAAYAGEAEDHDRESTLSASAKEIPDEPALATFRSEYGDAYVSPAAMDRRKADARKRLRADGLTFLKAPRTTRLLQRVVDKCLLPHSPRPDAPVEVRIVVEATPPAAGERRKKVAQADPSGLFVVSPARLAEFDTIGMVAFVLSHELAHVQMQHDRDPWGRVTGQLAKATEGTALQGSEQMLSGFGKSKLVQNMLRRAQEDDADFLGLDVMVKCGMAPQGALDTLERIRNWHSPDGGTLQDVSDDMAEASAKANDGDIGSFLGIFGTLAVSAVKGIGVLATDGAHNARSAQSRLRLIKDYIAAHHRNAPGGDGHRDPFAEEWDTLIASDAFANFLTQYAD